MPIYKDEKTNKYFVTFRYTDWQGKVHQAKKRGFLKSKDAKNYERDFLNKLSADSNTTFSNLVTIYLEDAKNRLRVTTYNNKNYLIASSITPFFGDTPISDITPLIVRKWQNSLIEKNYSQTYLRMLNSRLSAIFNFGVKYLNLKNNPVRLAGTIGKKYADTLNFWTIKEFKKFIVKCKDVPVFKTAYEVLFFTGIREGELLALTLADYDRKARTININKNYAKVSGVEYANLPPKTPKSKRVITMPAKLCKALDAYISQLYEPKPTDRLFSTLNRYSLGKELKRKAKLAGVKKIRVHDLRHSHASLLIELGFSPLLISERLGHEKVETTLQIYSHLYPNKAVEVASSLNKFF